MTLQNATIDEIKKGYSHNKTARSYMCLSCDTVFEEDEIYPLDGRFFNAEKAIERHIAQDHPDYLRQLIDSDSKYNQLTDHQKKLLILFSNGLSDKEIATKLSVSASTIRHQKFIFREKAKQARFYLAVYEKTLEEKITDAPTALPVHANATMFDERYFVTQKEKEDILRKNTISLTPLVLKNFPPKEKKKLVLLVKIIECFEHDKVYTEKEVNNILKPIYHDYVTIRRYLIEYGFMARERDGSDYHLT